MASRQADKAAPHYQEYQAIAKKLSDDSIPLRYTIDLATATHGLAACDHDADNHELALALCNEARLLIEQLLKIDAGNRAVLPLSSLVEDLARRVNSESAARSE